MTTQSDFKAYTPCYEGREAQALVASLAELRQLGHLLASVDDEDETAALVADLDKQFLVSLAAVRDTIFEARNEGTEELGAIIRRAREVERQDLRRALTPILQRSMETLVTLGDEAADNSPTFSLVGLGIALRQLHKDIIRIRALLEDGRELPEHDDAPVVSITKARAR